MDFGAAVALVRCGVVLRLAGAMTMAGAVGWSCWIVAQDIKGPVGVRYLLSLMVAVAYPLPTWWTGRNVYSWMVSPNFWTSPTTIVSMPFALLLFSAAVRTLQAPTWRNVGAVAAYSVLGLLAKPSYYVVFAPVFGLFFVSACRNPLKLVACFLPAAVLCYWQSRQLASDVRWAPYYLWPKMCPSPPFAVLASLAFPLVTTALYVREANRDTAMILGWCGLLVGLAQFCTLLEMNERWNHGNTGWGMLVAAHVLFAVCTAFLSRQPPGWRRGICWSVLGLQAISGVAYLNFLLSGIGVGPVMAGNR